MKQPKRIAHYAANRINAVSRAIPASAGIPLTPNEQRLRKLHNKHASRPIVVLGNGPSLADVDLELLRGHVTIASNGIFLLSRETGWSPSYYTVEDALVAEDRREEIADYQGPTRLFPWDLRRVLSISPSASSIYLNFRRPYKGFPRFSDNLARRAFWGGTVTYMNIQLAYYLGASQVILVGVDHSYEPPRPEDHVEGSVILSNTDDRNHFHPGYFGAGYRWHDPKVDRMETAYHEAQRFAQRTGRPIWNATTRTRLEVFPRIPLREALEKATSPETPAPRA